MQRKLVTLIVSIVLCISVIHAQKQEVIGVVEDAVTHQPITSATVSLGANTIASSNNGSFSFSKTNAGKYNLKVNSIGYKLYEEAVVVKDKSINLKIFLQSIATTLQPVEVKSLRAGSAAPFAKTNLQKDEIEKNNLGQDLPYILNQTPSVIINSDAGNGVGYTGMKIRGTDATRINVTLNGLPYNDAESQATYFVDIPDMASSLNSIQIQRGVGTSSNGTGAFGGTISLSTNEYNPQPYAELNNSFGSFNTWKNTIKAGSGLLNNHFVVDARLSQISSNGFIDRASSNLKSFALSGLYLNKNSSLRLNVFSGKEVTYQAWNGIPEYKLFYNQDSLLMHYYNNQGSLYNTTADSINLFSANPRKYNVFSYKNQTDNYQQDHYQLFFNHSFNSKLTFSTAGFMTYGRGYYEEYKNDKKYEDYGLPNVVYGTETIKRTDLIRQLNLDNYFYGQIGSLLYKNKNDEFSFGGGWTKYDAKHFGNIIWAMNGGIDKDYKYYNLTALKTDWNIYSKWAHAFNKNWISFIDVQYRNVFHRMNGFRENPTLNIARQFDFFNPKAGLTYNKNGTQFFVSYALGQKEPNRDDFEAGILSQPKAEKLHDFELGFEKKTSSYWVAATGYYMLYKDQLVLTGKVNDVGAYTRTNVDNSYRLGIELQGGYIFSKWLNINGNLTFSKNKIQNFTEYLDNYDTGTQDSIQHSNTDITLSPNIVGSAIINILLAKNITISLINKYVGKQYLDNTSDERRKINGYYTQDFRINYTCHTLFKETNLVLQINNLFNTLYEGSGYSYSYNYSGRTTTENFYYPMAGTNIMLGLNIRL